jgi:hypothetical protein
MRLLERRALTEGEIAIGRAMFGDEIPWARVRIFQAPRLGFYAMVPWGLTIVYSRLGAARDFAEAPPHEQGVFVHELAHVWQARRGVVLWLAKLGALGRKAYSYQPRARAALWDYNIESQAEIVRHLFHARCGACATGAPPQDWLEQIWARR